LQPTGDAAPGEKNMNGDFELGDCERAAVKTLAQKFGDGAAAKTLGISVNSLLRVVTNRTLRRGTLRLLREKLESAWAQLSPEKSDQ
jgi:hypothetical protein